MSATSRMSGREGVYLALLIAGTLVPYTYFVAWLGSSGLDVPLFLDELFANRISSFFGWDVIISVVTLWVLALTDRELSGRDRSIIAAGAVLGASVGLPMYLWLRERRRRLTTRPASPSVTSVTR